MEEVVFKIGSGKVVHLGTKYSNGTVESSCSNSFANERNKDLKEYSNLEEITCKVCYNHKKWYVDMDNFEKELAEKAKTYTLENIVDIEVGKIYKEKATHFHFSGKYRLRKLRVLAVETIVVEEEVCEIVTTQTLEADLSPSHYKDYSGKEREIINQYTAKIFKEDFKLIKGNAKNA